MSFYEEALKQVEITEKVKRNIYFATGKDKDGNESKLFNENSLNNKAFLTLRRSSNKTDYYFDAYDYRITGKDEQNYIVRAINRLMPDITKLAIQIAEDDLQQAKGKAYEEAAAIINQLS